MSLKLNASAWVSLAKGAAIAAAGAGLTYLIQHLGEVDLGGLAPIVTAGLSVLANYVRKLATTPAPTEPLVEKTL